MFNFLFAESHENRVVDRYESDNLVVDTCYVNDAIKPYETAVKHPAYNNNDWVIVEDYDSEENAQVGHDKWVEIMTAKELPSQLRDIANSMVAQLLISFSDDDLTFGKD